MLQPRGAFEKRLPAVITTVAQYNRLTEAARRLGVSRSELIRAAITIVLDQYDQQRAEQERSSD